VPIDEVAALPISALQHLLFCPRQCALIHLERAWAENRLTVEGQQLHRRAHEAGDERRGRVRIVRGLMLESERLGLVGKADVVEFEPLAADDPDVPVGRLFDCVRRSAAGAWRVTPVEYKRGKPKGEDCDRVQLCAQAICLEEMLGVEIASGELFYGRPRRRTEVVFDEALRGATAAAAERLHALIASGATPPARREAKCRSCSLVELCMPGLSSKRSAAKFVATQLEQALTSEMVGQDPFDEAEK